MKCGVETGFNVEEKKKEARKYLLECSELEFINFTGEQKNFFNDFVTGINFFFDNYTLLYPIVSKLLSLYKIGVSESTYLYKENTNEHEPDKFVLKSLYFLQSTK